MKCESSMYGRMTVVVRVCDRDSKGSGLFIYVRVPKKSFRFGKKFQMYWENKSRECTLLAVLERCGGISEWNQAVSH